MTDFYPLITDNDLAHAYEKPDISAKFKQLPEDFIVKETISFEPGGEGTHAYLYIEKKGTNTEWLAKQLAHFAKIPVKDVGYAGLKDRNAITYQWFSINLEGIEEPDWNNFTLDGVKIVTSTYHRKKLKRGSIKSNRFTIRLKEVDSESFLHLESKLAVIQQQGIPNYFGPQRFGHNYNNLQRAIEWFEGRRPIKKRAEKSIILSAARSMVFNYFLSQRISKHGWHHLLDGEVMMLNNTHSIFNVETIDATLQSRFEQGDINPTTAMWGRGQLSSQLKLLQLEQQNAEFLNQWGAALEQQGLKQERRSIRVIPQDIVLQQQENELLLSFALPSGCYATAVLRELIQDTTI